MCYAACIGGNINFSLKNDDIEARISSSTFQKKRPSHPRAFPFVFLPAKNKKLKLKIKIVPILHRLGMGEQQNHC